MYYILIFLTLPFYSPQSSFIIKEKKFTLKEGNELLYTISTPSKIPRKEKVPLIIALHWGWDRSKPIPPWFGKDFLTGFIQPAFEDIRPIIIAPDCPAENWYNEVSENAVLELMDFIMKEYPVDSGNIYISGYSAGGFGVWYLSSRHPGLFNMAIPIACKPDEEWIRNWKDLPVFIVHGTKDELFPFSEIEKLSGELGQKNVKVKLIRIENASHYNTGKYITSLKYSTIWLKGLEK